MPASSGRLASCGEFRSSGETCSLGSVGVSTECVGWRWALWWKNGCDGESSERVCTGGME
jgi:hypothetical protein